MRTTSSPTPHLLRRHRPAVALAAAGLVAAVALAGCAGGANDGGASAGGDSGSASSQALAQPAPGSARSSADKVASGASEGGDQAAAPAVSDQRLVREARLDVQARDVDDAVASVRRIAATAKGFVADEQTSTGPVPVPTPESPVPQSVQSAATITRSELTLRVPTSALDRVMEQVGAVGRVTARSQSSQDVTSQYVDVQSRVASQQASVDRVRTLLDRATSLGQVVQIEGELSKREADLESLEAQLKSLQDSTSLSTLTVTLTPVPSAAAHPQKERRHGFVAGLTSGWTAFVAVVGGLLTAFGAALPFLLLAALLGAPVALVLRRRRAGSVATTS